MDEFKKKLLIITPVYNDWESFNELLSDIDSCSLIDDVDISVVAINDGSTSKVIVNNTYKNVESISVLNLNLNVGHQRAIAIGLNWAKNKAYDFFVIMDSDGEDRVSDIGRLVHEYRTNDKDIIVAKRTQRSEGVVFRLFYFLYRFIFKFLTGSGINFGNFSLISKDSMFKICLMPELWNNYAATLLKSKIKIGYIDTTRGRRFFGKSKLGFIGLLLHGFSAISVFYEYVIVRLIITFSILFALGVLSLAVVLVLRFAFDVFIFPGWATATSGFLSIIIMQILVSLMTIGFMYLNGRSGETSLMDIESTHIGTVDIITRGE